MVEIVWRVYNELTEEEIANFLEPKGDANVEPEIADPEERAALERYRQLYGKTTTEVAAIEFCRSLNAERGERVFLVSRGFLVRDHRIPAMRNVVH